MTFAWKPIKEYSDIRFELIIIPVGVASIGGRSTADAASSPVHL